MDIRGDGGKCQHCKENNDKDLPGNLPEKRDQENSRPDSGTCHRCGKPDACTQEPQPAGRKKQRGGEIKVSIQCGMQEIQTKPYQRADDQQENTPRTRVYTQCFRDRRTLSLWKNGWGVAIEFIG